MNKDLTVGKTGPLLWSFCLPLFGSVIFQQLYNIADSLVAGKFIGDNALAAVGNSYEITLVFIAFAFGCNVGSSVVISQLFGGKKYREMKTAVYTTFISVAALVILLMALGLAFGKMLLRAIHTPDEIFGDSLDYLYIYIFSLPFVFFYNVSTGIFTALGDSKTPFRFLACSSVSNILMDILFVAKFKMGVPGVAWATFICQGVSCILAVVFVLKRFAEVETDEKADVFSFKLLGKIAYIAIPSTLQQSFVSFGNIILQGLINGFGPSVIAGYSASIKINNMMITSLTTLGNGVSSYTAQNIGAGKYERIREGWREGFKMTVWLCVPVSLLFFFGGRYILALFLKSTVGAAADTGIIFLRIVSPFYITGAAKLISDGVLRGAGLMKQFMAATFLDLFLRVGIAEILSRTAMGSVGIWTAWPFGWILGTVLSLIFCFSFMKKSENGLINKKKSPSA